jgi:hypothetical protein
MKGNYVTIAVKPQSIGRAIGAIRTWEVAKKRAVQREVVMAVLAIESGGKRSAPVAGKGKSGGYLRASIHSTLGADLLGGTIWAAAPYAPYQEFGTGALVNVPPGFEEFAMQYKGRGIRRVNIKAKHFLFNAWVVRGREFLENIERILSR